MTALAKIEYTQDQVGLIKRSVAKNCTDDELKLYLHLAQKYDLDPFAKEIWCIKRNANDPALIMTARDGYLKIANTSNQFDGMTSGVVKAGDVFFRLPDGSVSHTFGEKRSEIIGAFALVKRKDRSISSFAWAEFSEYKQNSPTWSKYPSAMIMKVAESMALKRAFTISGLVTQEEIGTDTPKSDARTTEPIDVEAEEVNKDDIMAALENGNLQDKPPVQQPEAAPIALEDKPSGQQIAIINSLIANPVFSQEERDKNKEWLQSATKSKCDKFIKALSDKIIERQKSQGNAAA